jgi:hypothetical protein
MVIQTPASLHVMQCSKLLHLLPGMQLWLPSVLPQQYAHRTCAQLFRPSTRRCNRALSPCHFSIQCICCSLATAVHWVGGITHMSSFLHPTLPAAPMPRLPLKHTQRRRPPHPPSFCPLCAPACLEAPCLQGPHIFPSYAAHPIPPHPKPPAVSPCAHLCVLMRPASRAHPIPPHPPCCQPVVLTCVS